MKFVLMTTLKIVFSEEISNKFVNHFRLLLLCTVSTSLNYCRFYVFVLFLNAFKQRSTEIRVIVRHCDEKWNVQFAEFLLW